ncbi:MAG: hypothetical protein ACTHOG_12810 [Marmoricola sp.]
MEQSKVMEAAKEVADKLDTAQEMLRNGQHKLCLAFMETIVEQGAVYWFAACMLLSQGIVMDTPEHCCDRHSGDRRFDADVIDAQTMRPTRDPLYAFSNEILLAFSKNDWPGFVDRLEHVVKSGRRLNFVCLLLSRLTQLQDQKAAGAL